MSRDPIGENGGPALHRAMDNDLCSAFDPDGRAPAKVEAPFVEGALPAVSIVPCSWLPNRRSENPLDQRGGYCDLQPGGPSQIHLRPSPCDCGRRMEVDYRPEPCTAQVLIHPETSPDRLVRSGRTIYEHEVVHGVIWGDYHRRTADLAGMSWLSACMPEECSKLRPELVRLIEHWLEADTSARHHHINCEDAWPSEPSGGQPPVACVYEQEYLADRGGIEANLRVLGAKLSSCLNRNDTPVPPFGLGPVYP